MPRWTMDDLRMLGPSAQEQLKAQGINIDEEDEPKPRLDFRGEPIDMNALLFVTFVKPVRGITYKGKGSDIGCGPYYCKLLSDDEPDKVVYEIPLSTSPNLLVFTTPKNIKSVVKTED